MWSSFWGPEHCRERATAHLGNMSLGEAGSDKG